jgi:D-alanine-D-alanine ligase
VSAGGPRVAVVYNRPALPPGHPDAASEADVARVAEAVARALERSGFQAATVAAGPPLAGFLAALEAAGADLVFNLVEGFAGLSALAAPLTAVFELLGLPFTGSTAEAFAVCRSKARAKALLRGLGLPTAPGALVEVGGPIPGIARGRPVVVKPDGEDGSLGIDQGSVVSDHVALAERVRGLWERYGGPVLVEEYLPGPEFNVGVVALPKPAALPVAQVVYADVPGRWPILTYRAKWDEGSPEDLATPVVCPAPIEPELSGRLGALAVSAFRATSCRDYARVDLRLNGRGEPMILEVNPNPDLGPGAGFARAASAAGWGYEEVVAAVARQALQRAGPGHRRQ